MIEVYSPCYFVRLAMRELFKAHQRSDVSLLVMDARAFDSVSEMNFTAMVFASEMPNARILVIRSDRFLSHDLPLSCSVNLSDRLAVWHSTMADIVSRTGSLNQSLACLNWYAGRGHLSTGQKRIIALMRKGFSVKMIAQQLRISEKTVYAYIGHLKKLFNQPRLCGLYRLFASWTH